MATDVHNHEQWRFSFRDNFNFEINFIQAIIAITYTVFLPVFMTHAVFKFVTIHRAVHMARPIMYNYSFWS